MRLRPIGCATTRQRTAAAQKTTFMLKKISVHQLQIGMFLHEVEGSWIEHGLWRRRFLIADADRLAAVVASGASEFWIDTSKGHDVAAATTVQSPPPAAPAVEVHVAPPPVDDAPVSLDSELEQARFICKKSRDVIDAAFADIRLGRLLNHRAVAPVVDEIVASVTRNASALIGLVRVKKPDDYTYMHSVAVCTLMVALARTMGMPQAQCLSAGLAGLFHDVGKARVPLEILQKPGKLTDPEFELVKSHPTFGHKILLEAGVADANALDVSLHHHEKIDGTGYPDRLKDTEISLLSRMGAICDVYDAVTSARPYKEPWDPAEAIAQMASWTGHFDKLVLAAFVKTVGRYPPGSLVRLASGRVGIVVQHDPQALQTPIVKVFFSTKSQMRIAPETIDLARHPSDHIVGREKRETWEAARIDEL